MTRSLPLQQSIAFSRRLAARAGVSLAAALLIGGFVFFAVFLAWSDTIDDAAISFAYAKNLAHGHGLVLSPGADRVEGYSNFLWVLIMTPVVSIGLDAVLVSKLLGLLLGGGTLFLLYRLPGVALQRQPHWLDLLAPTLAAAALPFALWSASGLENALEAFLLLAALTLTMREINDPRAVPWSSAAFVALALTRPEGVAFWFAAVSHRLLLVALGRRSRRDVAWFACVLVPLGLYHLWHYSYFGELVPNTYFAKAGDRSLRDLFDYVRDPTDPGFAYVRSFLSAYWPVPSFSILGFTPKGPNGITHDALPILVPLVALALLGPRGLTHYSLPLLMLLVGVGAVLFDGGDWMPDYRLMSPLIPLFYLMAQESIRTASLGVSRLASRPGATAVRAVLGVALGAVVFGSTLSASVSKAEKVRDQPFAAPYSIVEKRADRLERLARCLHRERASVLTPDIGGIAYLTDLRIIDMGGLGDRFIARHPFGPEFLDYVFEERRPDIIDTHRPWLKDLDEDPRLLSDYTPVNVQRDDAGNLLEGLFVRADVLATNPSCGPRFPGPA